MAKEIKQRETEKIEEKKLYRPEKATTSDEKNIEIQEKPVNNTIKINPDIQESMKQARKNVGASTCWKGYKAKGTKMKDGKEVPNCVKEEGKKGLWDNIHAKRKRGERPARPGEKGYPKTLNVEQTELVEKSVSKKQQRFMGMVHATKKGDMKAPSPEVAKAAASMTGKEAKDFAKTKHKGLPEKKDVKESIKALSMESKEAMDAVRASIEKEHGKGAILDTSPEGRKKRKERMEKWRKERKSTDTRDQREKETEGRYRSDGPSGAKRYQGD
jgi:putative hemolysin